MFAAEIGNAENNNRRVMMENKFKVFQISPHFMKSQCYQPHNVIIEITCIFQHGYYSHNAVSDFQSIGVVASILNKKSTAAL